MERKHDPREIEVITIRASQLEPGDIWLARTGSEASGPLVGYDASDTSPEARHHGGHWREVSSWVWGPDHGTEAIWLLTAAVPNWDELEAVLDEAGGDIAKISAALVDFGGVRYPLDAIVEVQHFPYRFAQPNLPTHKLVAASVAAVRAQYQTTDEAGLKRNPDTTPRYDVPTAMTVEAAEDVLGDVGEVLLWAVVGQLEAGLDAYPNWVKIAPEQQP